MSSSRPEGLYFFLASDQDAKYLHAEVYYNDFSICMVDTERGDFSISFFSDPRINFGQMVTISLDELMIKFETVKDELRKFPNGLK